jgi:hypothetical protein
MRTVRASLGVPGAACSAAAAGHSRALLFLPTAETGRWIQLRVADVGALARSPLPLIRRDAARRHPRVAAAAGDAVGSGGEKQVAGAQGAEATYGRAGVDFAYRQCGGGPALEGPLLEISARARSPSPAPRPRPAPLAAYSGVRGLRIRSLLKRRLRHRLRHRLRLTRRCHFER